MGVVGERRVQEVEMYVMMRVCQKPRSAPGPPIMDSLKSQLSSESLTHIDARPLWPFETITE